MSDSMKLTNGVFLPVRDTGKGEPVLAVHGAISDLRIWEAIRARLDGQSRFIAYTQRYFGAQEWPDDGRGYGLVTHVDDLISLIEDLGLPPVHLLTWSYGGHVGHFAALKRPDLFASAVHFEPSIAGLVAHTDAGAEAELALQRRLDSLVPVIAKYGFEAAANAFMEAVIDGLPVPPEIDRAAIEQMAAESARTLPLMAVQQSALKTSLADAAGCRVPSTFVHGSLSGIRYRLICQTLSGLTRKSRLVTLEGANHAAPVLQEEELAAIVMRSVAEHAVGGTAITDAAA